MSPEQEIKLLKEAERGAKAKSVYEDSFVQEALQAIDGGILDAWKKSPVRDQEGQVQLRLLYKCLHDFKAYFLDAMTTGKMAEVQLKHERSLKDRAGAAVREFSR